MNDGTQGASPLPGPGKASDVISDDEYLDNISRDLDHATARLHEATCRLAEASQRLEAASDALREATAADDLPSMKSNIQVMNERLVEIRVVQEALDVRQEGMKVALYRHREVVSVYRYRVESFHEEDRMTHVSFVLFCWVVLAFLCCADGWCWIDPLVGV